MARIKDKSVRDVIDASNIVEVVGLRTSLRKSSGTRYMGRCPFHEERSPSFSVNADLNLYHCFGCGKGGDVVTFVRETEGLDFVGAIEWLAERFRIPLKYEESSPLADESRRRRERLFAVLDQAASFFERHLWEGADGEPVRAYLASRGLGDDISKEFRLGLSPGSGLAAKAREKGFTADELRAAGLTNQRGNDYFPPRLMFPLADARGRVIGFQARKLHDDDPLKGKYVNSPESELFKKSNVLYGLHLARPAIAKQDRAVVVEGNTDVIALRQAGFEPVVASMGTALTEHHLRELARLTKRLYLCFDSDAAGEEATLRGMERAYGQGFEIRVVALPPGQDPADAPDGFEQRLGQAEGYLHYRVRLAVERSANREEGFEQVRTLLAGQPASPERDDAVRLAAGLLGLPPGTQARLVDAAAPPRKRSSADAPAPADGPARVIASGVRIERDALAAAMAHVEVCDALRELSAEHFDVEAHRQMREIIIEGGKAGPDLVPLQAELDARAEREGITRRTGMELLLRLRERKLRRDLQGETDLARATELQAHLAKVRQALTELA